MRIRSVGGTRLPLAVALALLLGVAPTPSALGAKVKEGVATLILEETGTQPPREGAAKSPLFHPGFDVSVPSGGLYLHRDLFDLEGGRHRLPVFLRRISEREVAYDGPAGRNWWPSLQSFLRPQEDASVVLFDTDGRRERFAADGDGYLTPPGYVASLVPLRKGTKVKGWTLRFPDGSSRFYDSKGRWKTWLRPDGQTVKLSSGSDFRLKKVKTPEKRTVSFKYGKDRRLASIQTPSKAVFAFTYDARGNLTSVHRPLREGDETPARWDYAYDGQDRLVQAKNSAGGVVGTVVYDGSGRVASITDFAGKSAAFSWDGNLLEGTDRDGSRMDVVSDENGQLLSRTVHGLETGSETETFEYDALLRRVARNGAAGDRMEWEFPEGDDPLERGNVLVLRHLPAAQEGKAVVPAELVTTRTFLPGGNDLLSEVRPDGGLFEFEWDDAGFLESVRGPTVFTPTGSARPLTSYRYDAFGRRTEVIHPDGSRDIVAYAKKPRDLVVESVRDAGSGPAFVNERTRYAYDGAGRLAATIHDDGERRLQTSDSWGSVTSLTDENGRTTVIDYDRNGLPVSMTTPLLDGDGDPVGSGVQVFETDYDALGRTVAERRPDGFGKTREVTHVYGNGLRLPTETSGPDDATVTVEYDARGRRASVVTSDGDSPVLEEEFHYDAFGNVVRREDAAGNAVEYEYDGYGRLLRTREPDGGTTDYDRDAGGRTTSVVERDAGGDQFSRTRYLYDPAGNMVGVERDRFVPGPGSPAGATEITTIRYNARGLKVLETDPCNATVAHEYDGLGRVVSREEQPLDRERTYTYDSRSRLATRTERRGEVTTTATLGYDAAGNVVSVDMPEGTTDMKRDSLGRLVNVVDPSGRTAAFTVDAGHHRLSSTTAGPSGAFPLVSTWTRDAAGNLASHTGPDGVQRVYVRDGFGRIIEEKHGGASIVKYDYDEAGRIASRTDAAGTKVQFAYDGRSRVVSRTASTGEVQTFSWNRHNRLLTGVDTPLAGSPVTVERAYDSLGNRLTDTQPGGTIVRTYGEGGRVDTLATPEGFLYGYERDPAGRVTAMTRDNDDLLAFTYVGGTTVPASRTHASMASTFTLDLRGRILTAIHDTVATTSQDASFEATYDLLGRRLTQERETGAGERWEYDERGRLAGHYMEAIGPSGGTPSSYLLLTAFTRDTGTGRPLSMTLTDGPAPAVTEAVATHSFGYDAAGRMTTGGGASLPADGAGRATTIQENRPAYDAGARNLKWDAFGRLVEVRRASNNSLLGSFAYDVLGRPVSAREEQFTGVGILTRLRVFDGCRLVSELSPLRNNPSDGWDLYYVPDPTGRGHVASGFHDVFDEEYLWQTDTRGLPGHLYTPSTELRNESYRLWSALGLPHFTNGIGNPFRGAPSLNTATAPPGMAASHPTGLQFSWTGPPRDPFLPRPLDPHPWGREGSVPFPDPPGPLPGPGGGDVGDPEPDWTEAVAAEDAAEEARCDAANADFRSILDLMARLTDKGRACGEDLDRVKRKRGYHLTDLDRINKALDEILETQGDLRDWLERIATADYVLNSLGEVAGAKAAASGLKDSVKNLGTMGKSSGKLFGGATGKAADKAVDEFQEAFADEVGGMLSGEITGAVEDLATEALQDAGVLDDNGSISTIGAYDALARLMGKSTTGDLLDGLARNFQLGIENRNSLKDALATLDRVERDRLSYKEFLRQSAATLCNRANQAIDGVREGWGDAQADELAALLADAKASLLAVATR